MQRRNLTPQILAALRDTPVVYLQGPRQSGKSTLAQALQDDGHNADYFTLDESVTLAAAQSDPDGFVTGLPERVILDEVQRVPELFRAIKRSVDAKRRPGRFLLTGSAQALVLPKLSESLAGRMEVLTLWPFSQGEIAGRREGFVDPTEPLRDEGPSSTSPPSRTARTPFIPPPSPIGWERGWGEG